MVGVRLTARCDCGMSNRQIFCAHSRGMRLWSTSVAFSLDGSKLASASWDKTVRRWDASTGEDLWTLVGHTDTVIRIAFSSNGSMLVSGSEDNSVRLWGALTGEHLFTFNGHTGSVKSDSVPPRRQAAC